MEKKRFQPYHDIYVYKINIHRNDCPSNRDINRRVKSITKELVGILFLSSITMPSKGDIIVIDEVNYVVEHIIHNYDKQEIIIQVYNHRASRLFTSGSDTWEETIPLCINIEEIEEIK